MIVKTASFVGSFPSYKDCPKTAFPEYAFIGRSNVGKSSLINYVTDRNKLAKVSHTPGKTKLINLFTINNQWMLTDLPGYGYAKVSKKERANWQRMIHSYFLRREQLVCVFQLIDSRIPPQKIDLDSIAWMGTHQIPFVIVYTKFDKAKKYQKNIDAFEQELLKAWESLPMSFITSSRERQGKEQLLDCIEKWNNLDS